MFHLWLGVWTFIVLSWFSTGCATTCRDPEARAAKHGTVLECKKMLQYQNGRQVARCTVSTPSGDKQFHYGVCE